MRRPELQPYRLIIPIHIARELASVERSLAAAIRSELEALAEHFGRNPPGWREVRSQTVNVLGVTVVYECDPRNEALVAMHLTKKA